MLCVLLCYILVFSTLRCNAKVYTASRTSDQVDNFNITPQGEPCSSYDATADSRSPHRCVCNTSTRSTFGFFDNRFRCFDYRKIRSRNGCNTGFQMDNTLYTLEIPTLSLNTARTYGFIAVFFPDLPCSHEGTQYYDCNGTWVPFNNSLREIRVLHYTLIIKASITDSAITGKLVRLQLKCRRMGLAYEDCLVFKVAGTQKCFAPVQSTRAPDSTSASARQTNANVAITAAPVKTPHINTTPVVSTTNDAVQRSPTTIAVKTIEVSRKQNENPTLTSTSKLRSNTSSLEPFETKDSDSTDIERSSLSISAIVGSTVAALLIVSAALVPVLLLKTRILRRNLPFNAAKIAPSEGSQSYDAKGAKFNRSYVPDVTNNCSVPIYEEILEMSASIKKEENLKKGSSFDAYATIDPEDPINRAKRLDSVMDSTVSNDTCFTDFVEKDKVRNTLGRDSTNSRCSPLLKPDAQNMYDNIKDVTAVTGDEAGNTPLVIYDVLEGPDPSVTAQEQRQKPNMDETETNIYAEVHEGEPIDGTYEKLGKRRSSIYQTLEQEKKRLSQAACTTEQHNKEDVIE